MHRHKRVGGAAAPRGYQVFPAARGFLAEFGGLQLDPNFEWNTFFDPEEALRTLWPAWLRRWETTVGKPLCPIGALNAGDSVMTIDPDGVVYSGYEAALVVVGDTPPEAVEMCIGPGFKRRVHPPEGPEL